MTRSARAVIAPLGWVSLTNCIIGGAIVVAAAFVRQLVVPHGRPAVIATGLCLMVVGIVVVWRREAESTVSAQLIIAVLLVAAFAHYAASDLLCVVLVCIYGVIAVNAGARTSERTTVVVLGSSVIASAVIVVLRFGAGPNALFVGVAACVLILVPAITVLYFRRQLEATIGQVRAVAATDPLTGLANRRGLADRIPQLLSLAARQHSYVAVLAADLDHFKRVNDDFGHAVGDEVLRELAAVISDSVRDSDLVARLGGEELCIVAMVDRPEDGGLLAERLRIAVQERVSAVAVTISIGAIVLAPHQLIGPSPVELVWSVLDRSDALLYEAKRAGRNAVRVTTA